MVNNDIGTALDNARHSGQPVVFGHRGCAAVALENTISAFSRARADGVPAVELDIQLSADNRIVVFHDRDLQRLAGSPAQIATTSSAELSKTDLADDHRGLAARGVPVLSDVLETLGPDMYVDIEIKTYAEISPSIAEALVTCIQRHDIADRVIVSSFDPRRVRQFRRAAAQHGGKLTAIPGAAIYARTADVPWILRRGAGRFLGGGHLRKPSWKDLSLQHRLPPGTLPWTVNDSAVAVQLRDLGAAGLIGDDPARLIEALFETESHGS
jgi:glycerophosphoryl diester phosphodiesterase